MLLLLLSTTAAVPVVFYSKDVTCIIRMKAGLTKLKYENLIGAMLRAGRCSLGRRVFVGEVWRVRAWSTSETLIYGTKSSKRPR